MNTNNLFPIINFFKISDGERLHYDLARNLTRYYAYDVIMTVRTRFNFTNDK